MLSLLTTAVSVGSTALSVGSKVASVAGRGVATAGRAMGRRRRRRRDRIQEQLFGKKKDGALVHAPHLKGTLVHAPGGDIVKSEKATSDPSPDSGILGILNSIRSSLEQILEIEKQQRDRIQESILNFTKKDEQAKRTEEQQKQEAKKPTRKRDRVGGAVKNVAAGPLAVLGDFVKLGILNWIGDPRNREAVHNIIEFFQGMVKAIQWTWKWIVKPLAKIIWIIAEPFLKAFGSFFTLLGNIFTGKIFTDPGEFFRSLIDFPWKLIRIIPDIIGGFVKWLFPALWNSSGEIIGGIIDAIRNLFGGIFGGGGDKSGGSTPSGASTNFAGGPMPGADDSGGKDGEDGSKGDSGTDGVNSPIPMGQGPTSVPELGGSTYNQDKKVEQQVVNPSPAKKGTSDQKGEKSVVQPTEKFLGDKEDKTSTAAKDEDKPQGFMRGLAGVGDFMTGGLFDLDKRGDSKFDTARKGILDFATGGLTDFDGKGGKTWGTARLLGGFADKITGDRWDFDRHGKSGDVLDEVQKESQTLDSVDDASQSNVITVSNTKGDSTNETADPGSLSNTFPLNGCQPYTTCL